MRYISFFDWHCKCVIAHNLFFFQTLQAASSFLLTSASLLQVSAVRVSEPWLRHRIGMGGEGPLPSCLRHLKETLGFVFHCGGLQGERWNSAPHVSLLSFPYSDTAMFNAENEQLQANASFFALIYMCFMVVFHRRFLQSLGFILFFAVLQSVIF